MLYKLIILSLNIILRRDFMKCQHILLILSYTAYYTITYQICLMCVILLEQLLFQYDDFKTKHISITIWV